jgi:hypothetical protein
MREIARRPEKDRRDMFRAAAQMMRVHKAIAMRTMLFGEIPSFEAIITELADLGNAINELRLT